MPKKLVIFDLDNTLVITKPAAKIAYQRALEFLAKKHGLEHSSDKLYNHWKKIVSTVMGEKKPFMRRFAYSLKLLMQQHNLPETHFQETLNRYEKELLANLEPQKGAKELLSWLKQSGHKVVVATGSERAEAVKKLKTTKLYEYIDALVTPNETEAMKPDPRFFQLSMQVAKKKPEHTIVVGDSKEEDIDPAISLGLTALILDPKLTHLGVIKEQLEQIFTKKTRS